MRSFARERSSSRRAPPMQASKRCSAIASSSVTVCRRLREVRGPVSSLTRPASIDSWTEATIEPLAELGDAAVAVGDDLREVVPGVDVHHGKRERPRAERLLGETQQHDRVLAAGEQQHRALALGRELAQDVDGLGLERVEVAQRGGAGGGVGGCERHPCSPHSVLSSPAQRPARPAPGCVQCVQPIEA